MTTRFASIGVMFTIGFLLPLAATAQDGATRAPLHISVTRPLTRVADVLTQLARQSGTPILADDTVVDTLGMTTLDKPTLEDALSALVPLSQGLTWQRVYLPKGDALPSAETLSSQVRSLKAIKAVLSVADPATQSVITLTRSSDTISGPPAGMQVVYLVTNETVRAQRVADQAAKAKKDAATPVAPVNQAVTGMQTAADDLGKMTPDEQRQAIPLMMQQMMRMMQSIDPQVRNELGQQWRQRGNAGGANGQ